MTRQLVYTEEKLAELPVGAVVRAHRSLGVVKGNVDILVRQPNGWFGAWGWEMPVDPEDVVPCTVISIESVRGAPQPVDTEWKPQADPVRYDRRHT